MAPTWTASEVIYLLVNTWISVKVSVIAVLNDPALCFPLRIDRKGWDFAISIIQILNNIFEDRLFYPLFHILCMNTPVNMGL